MTHCPEYPVPTYSKSEQLSSEENEVIGPDYRGTNGERKLYNQKDYNLIRDLALTKFNAEFLTARLEQWNLLDECFCHNVIGLFKAIGIGGNTSDSHVFIDV